MAIVIALALTVSLIERVKDEDVAELENSFSGEGYSEVK